MKARTVEAWEADHSSHLNDRPKVHFDLKGYQPEVHGDVLVLDLPQVEFREPLFSESAMQVFRETGLSDRDIDDLYEDAIESIQVKVLAKMLAARRIR